MTAVNIPHDPHQATNYRILRLVCAHMECNHRLLSVALPALRPAEIAASDKLEHFAAYAVLGFLGVILRRSKRDTFWVLFAIVVYGGLIRRSNPTSTAFGVGDFIANTCGALFGASLVLISSRVNTWRE